MYSAAPWSMSHGRPCHTSRFGFCGERSGFVTKPSNQTTSAAKSGVDDVARGRGGRVERQRAGQEVHPEIEPGARPDEVVDLLVGFGVAQGRIDLDGDEVGHGQADRPPELAGKPLGDERARTLSGATELDHVQAVVVRLDQPGQRPALAQGRDVAGRDDGPDHGAERSRSPGARRPCRRAQVARWRRRIATTLHR